MCKFTTIPMFLYFLVQIEVIKPNKKNQYYPFKFYRFQTNTLLCGLFSVHSLKSGIKKIKFEILNHFFKFT